MARNLENIGFGEVQTGFAMVFCFFDIGQTLFLMSQRQLLMPFQGKALKETF